MKALSIHSQRKGLIGSIIFHALMLLLVLYFGFTAPYPPPPEQGIMVNFGTEETGLGSEEPMLADKSNEQPTSTPPTVADKEQIMTQDVEEAPVIEKKKETVKKEIKKVVKPVVEPSKETTAVTNVKKEPVVNKKALYTGKKTGTTYSGSEGIAGGTGNQGSVDGSPDSNNHGPGGGSGTTFSLSGRSPLSLPKPEYNYQVEGKVVVDIIVDNVGNVVSATPGARGSTTTDVNLYSAARKAALLAKFDRKSDAPPTQKGTITYVFKLN